MKKFSSKTRRSSHQSSNKPQLKKLSAWLLVIVLLSVLFRPVVDKIGYLLTTPFFSIRHYIDTSSATIPVFIREREDLLSEIRELEQEVLARHGVNTTLASVLEENASLKALLHAVPSSRIAAGIIARPPNTPYDIVVIDKGQDDGILEQTPVFYGANAVLGYVQKVFSGHALVRLLSSPNVETSVYVFGPDVFATAYGQGGGVVEIRIPQGLEVNIGDIVITPSIEGGLVGSVERIDSNPTEPEQYAYVTYQVPIQSIRLVAVAQNPLPVVSYEDAHEAVESFGAEFLQFYIPQLEADNAQDFMSTSSSPE